LANPLRLVPARTSLVCIVVNLAALAISLAAFVVGASGATRVASGAHLARREAQQELTRARTGEEIYRATCVGCHGADGAGAPRSTVGFAAHLPDFTDCNFATREARPDWTAIVRDGGPVRGLSRIMPAFRDLLTPEEIQRVIQTFCRERSWPRGEFNLPLAQSVEKAFPEDEVVLTSAIDTKGPGSVSNHVIFEKRFGARDQIEVDVPFDFMGRSGHSWTGGPGDVSIVPKHVFFSSLASGTIVSGAAGVILPTGDRTSGRGSGTLAFEANVLAAQLLPARSYLQLQGNVELPTNLSRANRSVFWGAALGTTVPFSPITRIWSPMFEVTGSRDLLAGAPVAWDLVPQFQISLSALQHVRAGVGVDVPITEKETRHTQLLFYMLWDTFDGPLFSGWKGWCPGCEH
jgi:mono/diheme cytochrome c family protein